MRTPSAPRIPDDWTVWAFADPHGSASGLERALIEAGVVDEGLRWVARPQTALVGCGDYIDSGADSLQVVALLRRLGPEAEAAGGRVVLARGNHEHLLHGLLIGASDRFSVWLSFGGQATLEAYGIPELDARAPRATLLALEERAPGITAWLEKLPHAVRWRDVLFVHGGLPPGTAPDDLGRDTDRHLSIRADFFDTPWSSTAFGAYEAAGIRRVVFGHTPFADGPRLFHDGRSLGLDTNACGNPQLPVDARRTVTLVELTGDVPFGAARYVVIPTDDVPDRAVPGTEPHRP